MMVAEASSATSITLRVAIARGAASVAMNTSSMGVSTLPSMPEPRTVGGEGDVHQLHRLVDAGPGLDRSQLASFERSSS